jgi:GntR family transcriptional regulator/MocR family aminotransferase
MVMSLPRRLAWLEWARAHNGWILEDDYDSEFRYTGRPLPALQGLQPDARVIYIGTFSKVLLPGLRLGYLVVPEGLVDAFIAARRMNGVHSPQIEQVAVAQFIEQGHFNRHLRRMRVLYADRQEALVRAIKSELCEYLDADLQPAGMQLPARIDSRHAAESLVERAERAGLVLVPLSRFALRAKIDQGFLLGYTSFTPRKLKEGCVRLREIFRGK